MNYATICSGIGAPECAWNPLGWKSVFACEIEKFPSAVLAHHYPGVPNLGDMTKIDGRKYNGSVDLICAGTPCQSFSVAGLRKGMADPRGNLALVLLGIVDRVRPRWLVWENVPGVLSSNKGRDFGSFLGALGQLGYGFAYRVLDAQYVRVESHSHAVPQRRRRVFVVGYLGDWRRPTQVLFERESLSGNTPPIRETWGEVAGTVGARTSRSVGAQDGMNNHLVPEVCGSLSNGGHGGGRTDRTHIPNVSLCLNGKATMRNDATVETLIPVIGGSFSETTHTLHCELDYITAIPISTQNALGRINGIENWPLGIFKDGDPSPTLSKSHSHAIGMAKGNQEMQVRKLTPREGERLQGFPDDYTLIPYRKGLAKDGPRYKAIGNSMAVNVMRWIGDRIDMVERSTSQP